MMKINGAEITRFPAELEYQWYDLDSEQGSGRDQTGLMFRDRVAVKRKLTCKWSALTQSQLQNLLKQVGDMFFQLEYFDPYYGENRTITAYVGDRTAPVAFLQKDGTYIFESLSMNFIER